MNNLYLLNYNNYYNKIFKKLNTIAEYDAYSCCDYISNVNFVPSNGINTTHILNNWQEEKPDYLVVTDVNNTQIESRWFVIDADRLKNGQYRLTLKRDVLADYTEEFVNATSYINKAKLLNTDPLIFNDEAIKVNQILSQEVPLKDETGVSWIVAFLPKHNAEITDSQGNVINWESKLVSGASKLPEATYTSTSVADFKALLQDGAKLLNSYSGYVDTGGYSTDSGVMVYRRYKVSKNYDNESVVNASGGNTSYFNIDNQPLNVDDDLIRGFTDGCKQKYGLTYTNTNYATLVEDYNGKTVKIGSDIYRITISKTETVNTVEDYVLNTDQIYLNVYYELNYPTVIGNNNRIVYLNSCSYDTIQVTLTQIYGIDIEFNISTTRRSLKDQPYDMICLPYKDTEGNIATITYNNTTFTYDPEANLNIVMNMATTYGSSVVYDAQILPYCPVRDLLDSNGAVVIDSSMVGSIYTPIYDSQDANNILGFAFYGYESSGSFNIAYQITSSNPKLDHITKLFRLASPNYDNEYEFDPYMNGGLDYFNVDFTYLPYQSWIKLNPNYKYLYGDDFNDSRGLILGGSFSITKMDDAWANYQMQNVNYQNIFDRQIKNMKFNNKYQLIEQGVGSASQALGVGVGVGTFTNPVAGAVAGGLSAIGGAIDFGITRAKQKEALSYTKDMYNLNLQNVQALPQTISKITAFNINSKYFPFLKVYTTTPEEIEAVEAKLQWDGMTVGRIGKIDDYIRNEETYIQANIIRIDIADDCNIANAINEEVSNGIYIKRSDIV